MTKLFDNMTTDGLEETDDRLGGFQPLDTDMYDMTIKAMYAGQSDSGARSMTIIGDISGQEHRETIYFTNRNGDNFFLNKNDNTKKVPLPGFTTVDHLCLVATGSPLAEQEVDDKVVNVYDRDAGKELPKTVPMLTAAIGQTVRVAILRILQNKSKKEGNSYVDTAETREFNEIDKVLDPESRMTVVEALNGAEEATFHDAWLDRNKGKTRDKRTIKDGEAGQAGQAGRPGKPAPSADKPPKKSLFGDKQAA